MKKDGNSVASHSFTYWLKNNSLTITIQVVGFLVVLFNMWLALKLAPLAQSIDALTTRVEATELIVSERSVEIGSIDVIKTEIQNIKQDVGELKKGQDEIIRLLLAK